MNRTFIQWIKGFWCKHEWTKWSHFSGLSDIRFCKKCRKHEVRGMWRASDGEIYDEGWKE